MMLESWLIAWWVLLLAMGWYPCCCGGDGLVPCSDCPNGDGPPTGFSFDIQSGFVNNLCDCESIHGTWNAPFGINTCAGETGDGSIGCPPNGGFGLQTSASDNGDGTYSIHVWITANNFIMPPANTHYVATLNDTTACKDVSNELMAYSDSDPWFYAWCSGETSLVIYVSAY